MDPRNHVLDGGWGPGGTNTFDTMRGDKMAMQHFAKLLFCLLVH